MEAEDERLLNAAHYFDRSIEIWQICRPVVLGLIVFFCIVLVIQRKRCPPPPPPPSALPREKTASSSKNPVSDSGRTRHKDGLTSKSAGEQKPRSSAARVITGRRPSPQTRSSTPSKPGKNANVIRPLIFYSSLTGTTKAFSAQVEEVFRAIVEDGILPPTVLDLSEVDLDDFFLSKPKIDPLQYNEQYFYAVLIPSYDIDTNLTLFLDHLRETHHDFRINTAPLSGLVGYSIFGFGDKSGWPEAFCQQAKEVDKWMAKLTNKKRAYPLGMGDVKSDASSDLRDWTQGVCEALTDAHALGSLGEGVSGSGDAVESDEEVVETEEFPDNKRQKRRRTDLVTDLEDVGGKKPATSPLAVDFTTYSDPNVQPTFKPMVPKTSPTYAALTKQGYTIVGSHSGVKICRWTKSALRGRGSCYKNSFYGIASHLCMETTPSLSCSNKCVFCWRHGTNPVSTTWRWEIDDPEMIFNGAKQGHYQKIKMMRGVPGVRADRFEEAMRIRHCALSLVGEPIFYPRINEFLHLLHQEHISSFLVCNAQHPKQLQDLHRVTQLYVSIDASNKESLRKVDRPLHRDFWERFQSCLSILREKRFIQRTVFRLTLVKGFNMSDEIEGYATLIEKALPCFIEIKGVTYCGTSTSAGAGLTMQNVPFYDEICTFVQNLNSKLIERQIDTIDGGYGYGIAAEHAHSCCILLASKRFLIQNKWHTRIDYGKFFELMDCESRTGQTFGPEDYCQETEEWALWGNGGFDPRDERVDRKGRPKEISISTGKKLSQDKEGVSARVVEI